ncbi:hypothetical protein DENIS_4494 [Desulfonema ishimotonii]|uniref:DUF177 domain-containing protein n=1 Tax=Desulfonema ishimotonii TaxID=45657 RepID=A0A401G2P1_9BACT|nr:DUF177 domain-containing protein [Desulfonema ishimotonii]GBC63500.1 hypothetical protein DENIS_4494 [Desulfonema ishimotonii]
MKIFTENIPEEGFTLEFEKDADNFPILTDMGQTEGTIFAEPVRVQVQVRQQADMTEVRGDVETVARLACRRCLREFSVPLRRWFTLYFTRTLPESAENAPEKGDVELTAEETGLIQFQGKEIDLRDAIQEQLVMALPAWPLCSADCKGLCPKCGADLNQGDCGCDRQDETSPFAALKNLKVGK